MKASYYTMNLHLDANPGSSETGSSQGRVQLRGVTLYEECDLVLKTGFGEALIFVCGEDLHMCVAMDAGSQVFIVSLICQSQRPFPPPLLPGQLH